MIVDPADRSAVFRAIEMQTILWGGAYNPIIPSYRRLPSNWDRHKTRGRASPAEIVEGYLDAFDPDLVVPVGRCADRGLDLGSRVVVQETELIGDLSSDAVPEYGIGLLELLSDFIEKELKYARIDALRMLFPTLRGPHKMFLASIFGAPADGCMQLVRQFFAKNPHISESPVSVTNYADLLTPELMFPRRLTCWALEQRPLFDAQLFVCDATSTLDVIDYWNLRAAGRNVIPIAIQAIDRENLKNLATSFIEENSTPLRSTPERYAYTTVQVSRSLSEQSVTRFMSELDVTKHGRADMPKYSIRSWHPRLWDAWSRERAGERIGRAWSHGQDFRLPNSETRIDFDTVDPKFRLFNSRGGHPRFANRFGVSFLWWR